MKKILIFIVIFVFSVFNFNIVKAYDSGCTSSGPYSTTTGKLCSTPVSTGVCKYGHLYDTETGKLCTSWESKPKLTRELSVGSKGSDVLALQKFLKDYGFFTGKVDWSYGPITKASVSAYQKANNLPATGIVDLKTLIKINASSNLPPVVTAPTPVYSNPTPTPTTPTPNPTPVVAINTGEVLPAGIVGTTYSTEITATGGSDSYNWTLASGALPAGLMLTQYFEKVACIQVSCLYHTPAIITGTPTTAGVYNFSLNVLSGFNQATKAFSLTISDPVLPICDYAHPPAGFHYENLHTHPPCGADLVPN